MAGKCFIGWTLSPEQREMLLRTFPPAYPDVIADHITLDGNADPQSAPPDHAEVTVIGEIDDGDGLQALVAEVNGSTSRPDGGTFHITWSLDRKRGRRPVQSN